MKFLLILFIILFSSCSKPNIESVDILWDRAIEHREKNDFRLSITNLKSIIENYPNSNYSSKSHFQIADIYLNDIKDYLFAIKEFEMLIRNYPEDDLAKKSAFMVAYIYSNNLDEYSMAIEKYEIFLNNYPKDELIPSVQFELENLRKHEPVIDSLNNFIGR